jgi:hypothetical protein
LTARPTEIEVIESLDEVLAFLIPAAASTDRTTFLTPAETTFQTGFVAYPAGGEVVRHAHRPLKRTIVGTAEVLIVREGACEADIYDRERRLVATRLLAAGDVIVLLAGGHGFRMLENTVLLEVKQGPYTGTDEKERF